MACRSEGFVSPERTAVRMRGSGMPSACPASDDALQGFLQVLLDVVAERLERREVEHRRLVAQLSGQAAPDQLVDGGQECRQRLARPRRRGDERVATGLDLGPAAGLHLARALGEAGGKPARNRRMKAGREHAFSITAERVWGEEWRWAALGRVP